MISTKKIVFQELLCDLIASINGLTQLWHQHLEHLNIQSLHFLSQKRFTNKHIEHLYSRSSLLDMYQSKHNKEKTPKKVYIM